MTVAVKIKSILFCHSFVALRTVSHHTYFFRGNWMSRLLLTKIRIHALKLIVLLCCLLMLLALSRNKIRSFLITQKTLVTSEAIVLLAGSYEERAPLAISLYRTGNAGSILLTDDGVRRGWSREHQRNLFTTERGVEDLVKQGIPRHSIVALPFRKSGTVYDALAVRDYVIKHKIRSILLVTSDYHTRRSLWIFRRVLKLLPVTIGIVPAPSVATLFPDIALEYIKFGYYLVRFGMVGDG